MENSERIYAIVDWYDEKKGFGIAKNNEVPLFLHSTYLKNKEEKIKAQDIISCSPARINNIYYATDIELVNQLDKQTEQIIKQYVKKQ